jgi:hypothetical protein
MLCEGERVVLKEVEEVGVVPPKIDPSDPETIDSEEIDVFLGLPLPCLA